MRHAQADGMPVCHSGPGRNPDNRLPVQFAHYSHSDKQRREQDPLLEDGAPE